MALPTDAEIKAACFALHDLNLLDRVLNKREGLDFVEIGNAVLRAAEKERETGPDFTANADVEFIEGVLRDRFPFILRDAPIKSMANEIATSIALRNAEPLSVAGEPETDEPGRREYEAAAAVAERLQRRVEREGDVIERLREWIAVNQEWTSWLGYAVASADLGVFLSDLQEER